MKKIIKTKKIKKNKKKYFKLKKKNNYLLKYKYLIY